jgi:hypothetical protein
MDLYQRIEKALNDGVNMSRLEHRYWPLRESLEDHSQLAGSSCPTARGAGFIFGSLDIQLIDEYTKQMNELRKERSNRIYASGDKKLNKLEIFVENFVYTMGHKIWDLRQWYVGMKKKCEIRQYNKRKLRAIRRGWSISQFFDEEARIYDNDKARRKIYTSCLGI